MNTSADVLKFKIIKCLNVELYANADARGRRRYLELYNIVHELAQSNRACSICNFVVLDFRYGFLFLVFCDTRNKHASQLLFRSCLVILFIYLFIYLFIQNIHKKIYLQKDRIIKKCKF